MLTFNHFLTLTGTNQWDPLPDMNEIRSDFSAVTFGSSVFAIGGDNWTDVLGGVEEYNFEEGVWKPYTSLVTPRYGARFISTLVATTNSFANFAGPSCTRTRCTFWAGTTTPTPHSARWSASPQDLLAPGLCGTR